MIEKVNHIKNPLTVIAIFAGISEISGTAVLPFISAANQAVYIWFLILFPFILVVLFFVTLNFNHSVLYAPSDWKDENNFFKQLGKPSQAELQSKLELEAAEAFEEVNTKVDGSYSRQPVKAGTILTPLSNKETLARYSHIEDQVIKRLSKLLGLAFQAKMTFESESMRRIIFDAFAFDGDKVNVIEIKTFRSLSDVNQRLVSFFHEVEHINSELVSQRIGFVLHYAAVKINNELSGEMLERKIRQYAAKFNFDINIHVYSIDELESQENQ